MLRLFSKTQVPFLVLAILILSSMTLSLGGVVSAQSTCVDGTEFPVAFHGDPDDFCASHGGYGGTSGGTGSINSTPNDWGFDREVAEHNAAVGDGKNCNVDTDSLNKNNCGIVNLIVLLIRVLSSVAGIVIVASIIIGGIQYSAAGPDPQKVSAAKARIRNAVIALLLFLFGVGLLNYLVPGGII